MTTGRGITIAAERLIEPIEGMHSAIASRNFHLVGPVARPIQRIHDTIAGAVYGSIRLGAAAVGAAIDRSWSDHEPKAANGIVSFVNAVWGDDLGRHEARLSVDMSIVTASGRLVTPSTPPERATHHLVVLLHGLGQTEASWRIADTRDLVDRLDADGALTPLLVRYNTGRSVAANGRDLATLLESTVTAWPVEVDRITMVGHSLGGLVAHSACSSAHDDDAWLSLVRDLITTGTPYGGAPAEKAANAVAWGLGFASVTRPLATFINRRSRGIKDLRFGAICDTDWGGNDPDALLRNTATAHALPDHIAHHVIATTVADATDGPIAWLLGDGMVRTRSATTLRSDKPATTWMTGGVTHFSMQRHEAVLQSIIDVLHLPEPL